MKTYIKFLLFVVVALFLFSAGALLVNAEDETSQEETKNRYKTEITMYYDDFGKWTGGTATYTIYSDKPFYIFYRHTEEPGTYLMYFCGNLEDFDYDKVDLYNSSSLSNVSISGMLTLPDGSQQMATLPNSAVVYQGKKRITVTATCPIFYTAESLKNYLETGDESGWTNKPEGNEGNATYDESLGYIQGLSIESVLPTDCHGSAADGFTNCFQLSWDIPAYDRDRYIETYEMKFDMQYAYMGYYGGSKLIYDSALIDSPSISVSEGTHIFCAHDFCDWLHIEDNFKLDFNYVSRFNIQDLKKIYVRLVRVDRVTGVSVFGDWAIFDVDFRKGLLNDRVIGDANIYPGNFEIGSDGSINGEPIQTIPGTDSGDDGFSFAGIDLTDVVNIGKYFIGLVKSLINMIGDFPALFNRVFLFLPAEIRTMIYMFFVILVVSGLLKIFV